MLSIGPGVFFSCYNDDHSHSGLNHFTPQQVHDGLDRQILDERLKVPSKAFETHPERFVKGVPFPKGAPSSSLHPPPTRAKNEKSSSTTLGVPSLA